MTNILQRPNLATETRHAFRLYTRHSSLAEVLEASINVTPTLAEINQNSTYRLAGATNPSGQDQTETDVNANSLWKAALARTRKVQNYFSEEEHTAPVVLEPGAAISAFCDPQDGSKNEAYGWPCGSILGFSDATNVCPEAWLGTIIAQYGSKTIVGVAAEDGPCRLLQLSNQKWGVIRPDQPEFQFPKKAKYALLGGELANYPVELLVELQRENMKIGSSRCLAADVIFSLANGQGGLFICAQEKLRVLYEILPVGFFVRKAGGSAYALRDGRPIRLEDLKMTDPIATGGFICGSTDAVENALGYLNEIVVINE